jgi:hypothetical protein
MFETLLASDVRILSFELLENGNYLITLKPEYVNPESNTPIFETAPAVSTFDGSINTYANPV